MKSINPLVKILAVIGLTSALAATTSLGQPLITVDELGNGTFNGTVLPSGQKADPFSGIVTLAYQLPFPGVPEALSECSRWQGSAGGATQPPVKIS